MFFSFIQQADSNDCGPACIRMIVQFYKKDISLQKLRELCLIDREGVSLSSIEGAFKLIGFDTAALKIPKHNLHISKDGVNGIKLPLIVFWERRHFIVVYKINGKKIYIADPASGKAVITMEQFLDGWLYKGDSGIALAIQPNGSFHSSSNPYLGEKKSGTILTFLSRLINPQKKLFFYLFLLLIIQTILQMALPFLTKYLFDDGIFQGKKDIITYIFFGQIILYLGQSVMDYFHMIQLNIFSQKMQYGLLVEYLKKILHLPLSFFNQKKISDFINRTYDYNKIDSFISHTLSESLVSVLSFVIFSVLLIYFSVKIFLTLILFSLLYFGWLSFFLKRKKEATYSKYDFENDSSLILIELIQGIQEIKILGSQEKRTRKYVTNLIKGQKINLSLLKITQSQSIGSNIILQVQNILITYLTSTMVIDGNISIGLMMAIQFIIGYITSSLQQLFITFSIFQELKLSLDRIFEIRDSAAENQYDDTHKVVDPKELHCLKINNLSFKYYNNSLPVLNNINLQVKPGSFTAFVGQSGSGKTTLMKLLLGFYKIPEDSIHIGDDDFCKINLTEWRKQCGVVLQDSLLFSDTVISNITESDIEPDYDRYLQAISHAGILEFIVSLPIGHQTKIGPNGVGLSQGQKQRMFLARMIYKSPNYLFLDEATNSLDSETEKKIMDNISNNFSDKTRIVIAHRLNSVINADNIFVFHAGEIVEEGNHKHLLSLGGYYYKLFIEQMVTNNE